MRIIHTSDWHLGRSLHGVPLMEEQHRFLEWLAQLARERQADAVLVSGDVYDRALPPVDAVGLLEDGLDALARQAAVVVIPGNHDSAQRLGFGSHWFTNRLRIQADVAGAAVPIEVPDARGETGLLVYAVPYLDPDLARPAVAELCGRPVDEIGRSHEAVLGAVVGRARIDLEKRRAQARLDTDRRVPTVLVAHAFVAGGQASESERDIRVGGVDCVPFDALAGFDYAALGHLHGPQSVGSPEIRYSGSPLPFSFSERDQRKSVAVVDFDEAGKLCGIDLVPTPVSRRLSDIEGTLDEVLSGRYADRRDDWVRITIRGAQRPDNLLATLRQAFPHVLEHRFVSTAKTPGRQVGIGRDVADPVQVSAAFVDQATGAGPTPAEQAVLRSAYEAALAAVSRDTRDREGGL